MGEDHPLEILGVESSLGEEANDGPEAAGVAGIDDGKSVGALIEIGMRASNSRDSFDHNPYSHSPACAGGSGPAGPREPRFSAMRAFEASWWGPPPPRQGRAATPRGSRTHPPATWRAAGARGTTG